MAKIKEDNGALFIDLNAQELDRLTLGGHVDIEHAIPIRLTAGQALKQMHDNEYSICQSV
jgi:hypothetical protein